MAIITAGSVDGASVPMVVTQRERRLHWGLKQAVHTTVEKRKAQYLTNSLSNKSTKNSLKEVYVATEIISDD